MKVLGNILWILIIGWISAALWVLFGVLCFMTIIMIPFGYQCFKIALFSLCPFGQSLEFDGGPASVIVNIIWAILFGLPIAAFHVAIGIMLCMTIVGIPFGLQCFKIAAIGMIPFGSRGVSES